MSGRKTRSATSRRGRRRGGALLRGADAVLLPERETRAGETLATAFPRIGLDPHRHRTESLAGDVGALLDVRVLVEEDAAREGLGVREGTRTPDLRGHKAFAREKKPRNGGTLALGAPRRGAGWAHMEMIGP